MSPHAPAFLARHAGAKLAPCSSSPSDRHFKAFAPASIRACQQLLHHSNSFHSSSNCNTHKPAGRTAATTSDNAATEHIDPETVRLVTAASILRASQSDSDEDVTHTASSYPTVDDTIGDNPFSLSVLDELTVLDADSLALAVGILRQHQPIGADEVDVQLSERLRDFLLALRKRPTDTAPDSRDVLHPVSNPTLLADAADDGFWAGPDEWADVRSALMSIGINASLDEEDDESAWTAECTIEEEGPARRTRLLKSLPRLDSETAAELAAFLAGLQQRALPSSTGGSSKAVHKSSASQSSAADEQQQAEDQWWDEVTQAYQKLWRQAQVQQAVEVK